jgi:hypothetical protein
VPAFRSGDPQALADALLSEWSRDADDATVVVVDGRLLLRHDDVVVEGMDATR